MNRPGRHDFAAVPVALADLRPRAEGGDPRAAPEFRAARSRWQVERARGYPLRGCEEYEGARVESGGPRPAMRAPAGRRARRPGDA